MSIEILGRGKTLKTKAIHTPLWKFCRVCKTLLCENLRGLRIFKLTMRTDFAHSAKFSHTLWNFRTTCKNSLIPKPTIAYFGFPNSHFAHREKIKKRGLWILNGLCETNFAHPAPACTLSEIQNGVCEFILKFPPSPNSPIFPPFHKHPPIANLFATLRPLHSVTLSLTHSKPPCKPTPHRISLLYPFPSPIRHSPSSTNPRPTFSSIWQGPEGPLLPLRRVVLRGREPPLLECLMIRHLRRPPQRPRTFHLLRVENPLVPHLLLLSAGMRLGDQLLH